jgi:hypothetical protein
MPFHRAQKSARDTAFHNGNIAGSRHAPSHCATITHLQPGWLFEFPYSNADAAASVGGISSARSPSACKDPSIIAMSAASKDSRWRKGLFRLGA